MANQQTAEQNPTRTLVEANIALFNAVVEGGYKAQTRGLNVARVFIEAAGRQQETVRKVATQLANPALPWYSPERYSLITSAFTENSNEALRISREYIDELNAGAAEARQTVETIIRQAGKAREAQQALYGEGFSWVRNFARNTATAAARTGV
jgi:hypothetical protein